MTIQLHISKALATDLKPQLVDAPTDLHTMQWYGHRVPVLRRKCVILMEAQSRYAMVFTGLTKPDFENFPALVRDRTFGARRCPSASWMRSSRRSWRRWLTSSPSRCRS